MEGQTILREANRGERRMFYEWMKAQFPGNELKPLIAIEALCAKGCYTAYGLWNGGALIAYALLGRARSGRCHLLDYFAVLPQYQDAGWGSRLLAMLRAELEGDAILLEAEDPDCAADAADREVRRRRVRFYERNGCADAQIRIRLFSVDYAVMQLPLTGESAVLDVRRELEGIYHSFLPGPVYRAQVRFKS